MKLRILWVVLWFRILLWGNLAKAELELYPEQCDGDTICAYLKNFGFPLDCLDKIQAINQSGDAFDIWKGCFNVVSRSRFATLHKLIAILYLCEIGAMQIEALKDQPSLEQPLICDLSSTICEYIKVFDQDRYFNLLTTEALRKLLQDIWELLDYTGEDLDAYADTDAGYFLAHRTRSDSVAF